MSRLNLGDDYSLRQCTQIAGWRYEDLPPDVVRTLEYSFDRKQTRRRTGERIDAGVLLLNDKPGWGVEPPA